MMGRVRAFWAVEMVKAWWEQQGALRTSSSASLGIKSRAGGLRCGWGSRQGPCRVHHFTVWIFSVPFNPGMASNICQPPLTAKNLS